MNSTANYWPVSLSVEIQLSETQSWACGSRWPCLRRGLDQMISSGPSAILCVAQRFLREFVSVLWCLRVSLWSVLLLCLIIVWLWSNSYEVSTAPLRRLSSVSVIASYWLLWIARLCLRWWPKVDILRFEIIEFLKPELLQCAACFFLLCLCLSSAQLLEDTSLNSEIKSHTIRNRMTLGAECLPLASEVPAYYDFALNSLADQLSPS